MQSSNQIVTTNEPTPRFLQAGCHSCRPTNSVRALKGNYKKNICLLTVKQHSEAKIGYALKTPLSIRAHITSAYHTVDWGQPYCVRIYLESNINSKAKTDCRRKCVGERDGVGQRGMKQPKSWRTKSKG